MTRLLNTKVTSSTTRILKKLKCPREKIHVGGGKGYRTYGFNFKNTKLTEEEDFNRRCHFIKNKASNKALDVLQSLSEKYVKDYQFPRPMPWENNNIF